MTMNNLLKSALRVPIHYGRPRDVVSDDEIELLLAVIERRVTGKQACVALKKHEQAIPGWTLGVLRQAVSDGRLVVRRTGRRKRS